MFEPETSLLLAEYADRYYLGLSVLGRFASLPPIHLDRGFTRPAVSEHQVTSWQRRGRRRTGGHLALGISFALTPQPEPLARREFDSPYGIACRRRPSGACHCRAADPVS